MMLQGCQHDYSCGCDPNSPSLCSPRQLMPPIVARWSPLSSHSSIAIDGDSGHQKHHCSCNTDLSIYQSSPGPVGEPHVHGAGLRSSQGAHLSPASITPFDQTSGRRTGSHLLRLSLNSDRFLSHGTPWTTASRSRDIPGPRSRLLLRVSQTRTSVQNRAGVTVHIADRGGCCDNRWPGTSEYKIIFSRCNQLTCTRVRARTLACVATIERGSL